MGRALVRLGCPRAFRRLSLHALAPFLALAGVSSGCEAVSVEPIPPVQLELSPGVLTLVEEEEAAITATVLGNGGEVLLGRPIAWTSDLPAVATVDPSGVVRGTSPGRTLVRAGVDGLSAQVDVTVLRGPSIAVQTDTVLLEGFAGGATPSEFDLSVTNGGSGVLSGLSVMAAVEGPVPGWLSATITPATAPATLRILASPANLPPGSYRGSVEAASPVARDGPRTIPVRFEVREPLPRIGVDAASISLGAPPGAREPATVAIGVANLGGGLLTDLAASVEYVEGAPGWLTATLADTIAPTVLELEASAADLPAGLYRARVALSSLVAPAPPVEVAIEFNVSPPSAPDAPLP